MSAPRLTLDAAILALRESARACRKCGTLYVGGRRGNVYCSVNCARADAQRAYRRRQKVAA